MNVLTLVSEVFGTDSLSFSLFTVGVIVCRTNVLKDYKAVPIFTVFYMRVTS